MATLPLIAILLAAGCGGSAPPDIILISIDTLRADRLGSYGHGEASTPTLDALARQGILFEQVSAPTPLTLPSHATLFTGLIPPHHGVRDNLGFRLPDSAETLAERLAAVGYQTAAFVSAAVLSPAGGLDQGFEHYDDQLPGGVRNRGLGIRLPERYAELTLAAALEWMRAAAPDRPAFVFVHLYDPHSPYVKALPGAEDSSYDGEIAHVDRELGRLFQALDAEDRWKDRVTLVTADHGESLGEHGESTHALLVYEATLRVPLILHGAGGAGSRRADPVGLVDVAPTLLALAGAPAAPGDGRSLLEAPAGERSLYFESLFPRLRFGWAELRGVRRGPFKWIQAPHPELYDLASDPGETHNLREAEKSRARDLSEVLQALIREEHSAASPVSPERREALESLGYLSAPSTGEPADAQRPDPKDRIAVYEELKGAMQAIFTGRLPEALRRFAALEPEMRSSPVFYQRWGDLATRAADMPLAMQCYRKSLELAPDGTRVRLNLGVALYGAGARQLALDQFRLLLQQEPDHAAAHLYSGIVIGEQRGDLAAALTHLREFLRLAPDHPQAETARRAIKALGGGEAGG